MSIGPPLNDGIRRDNAVMGFNVGLARPSRRREPEKPKIESNRKTAGIRTPRTEEIFKKKRPRRRKKKSISTGIVFVSLRPSSRESEINYCRDAAALAARVLHIDPRRMIY